MSNWKMNNPGCCDCIFCRKTQISVDECKLIVNRQRVTKIIWEIVSISDPWERWISPPSETGTYISFTGTSNWVGQYVVDLTTANATNNSPNGCNASYQPSNSTASNYTFYHPNFTESGTGSMVLSFAAGGGNFGLFSVLGITGYTTAFLSSSAIDICNEIPETTYQLSSPIDRGSTTVWKMSHGFD